MQHSNKTVWKRGIRVLALGASTLMLSLPAAAQNVNVFVDGGLVNFAGVPPTTQNGRLLVPLRGVFEALGAVVDYNAATRTIDALRGETRLRLTLGSSTAFVNGQPVQLDAPATTSVGRTLVPLRFVGEAFGAQVNWNPVDSSVVITSPAPANPFPNPVPTPRPTPEPIPEPPVEEPAAQTTTGTVVSVDAEREGRITIRSNNVDRTYSLRRNATVERRPLLNRSTMDNPQYGTPITISLDDIRTGENVELTFNRNNQVTRVVAMPNVSVVRVRSVSGNRITLDDGLNTQLNIGSNLRYLDPQGREANTVNLQPGDEVVLFVGPDRRIYQVSAARADLSSAYGREIEDNYLPPVDYETPTDANRPQIDLVTFTSNNPNGLVAKAGDVISINVRGTAGLRGAFDLSGRAFNLPLRERPQRPGNYFATYTVRPGDDVTNGRVTVRLATENGNEATQQSLDTISIDTEPPVIIGTRPLNGASVNNSRPNILVYAEELGSGLAPSTITITNRGETFEIPATAAQTMSVNAIPPRDLSGRVNVRAEIRDEAGNVATHNFSFTVGRGGDDGDFQGDGAITSIFHNANRVLMPGERLTVDMIAESGGRASFDLLDSSNRVVARDIPMTEVQRERGRYRGEYTIQGGRDTRQLRIVGRFRDNNGVVSTAEATTDIDIVDNNTAQDAPTITSPSEGDLVGNQITVRGRGTAGNTINVTVRAQGTQYYVLPYSVEITAPTLRVRNNGIWETAPITLPRPRNVSGLRFVISAVQTDNANRTSEETTVTVRPQQ